MSAVTPQTEVYLLKCPLELDNQNQLDFATKAAQETYFKGLPRLYLDEFSYQRKDSVIRVNRHIDTLLEYTYVMYKNDNYSNKWFYAFITNMEYVNDNCTYVTSKTDVWQTWQFDLSWKQCFVSREHTNDDTFGKNLVPENLETGEYVVNKEENLRYNDDPSTGTSEYAIYMQVTELPAGMSLPSGCSKMVNNVASGCYYIGLDYDSTGITAATKILEWYDSNDKAGAVLALFVAPETITPVTEREYTFGGLTFTAFFPQTSDRPTYLADTTFAPSTSLNGYQPKNNKTRTYPYNYLLVSNNNGETFEYRFEEFYSINDATRKTIENPTFVVIGALTQGCQIKAYPENYMKGADTISCWDYGINGAKYPILSWTSDYYLNWQAENSASMFGNYLAEQAVTGIAGTIGQVAMGGVNPFTAVMGTMNIFNQINSAVHQQSVAAMQPKQAKGNTNSGDLNFAFSKDQFTFKQMCVRDQFAKRIDDYFSAYGYQTNEYKIPNRTGRANWNFVQTKGCNITADMPQQDLEEIKEMFNSGITIWHNPSTFMDYSQSNSIVS